MPQADISVYGSQIFWMCVSFGLLFWFVQFRIMPKIHALQDQRFKEKEALLNQAQITHDQAVALEKEIEEARQKAKEDADAVVANAMALREDRMQKELYDHQTAYLAQMAELNRTIEHERTMAWKTLYHSVPDLCDLLTKKWRNTPATTEEAGTP